MNFFFTEIPLIRFLHIFVYVGGSSSSSPFGGGIELRNNPCKSWSEHKKLVVSLLDSIL